MQRVFVVVLGWSTLIDYKGVREGLAELRECANEMKWTLCAT